MATSPDADVRTRLLAQGAGTQYDVFMGPVRDPDPSKGIPDEATFCLANGGREPMPFLQDGNPCYRWSSVQVRVRSAQNQFAAGQTRARAVREALHISAISGYVAVRVRESEPLYLGQDESGHHHWSVNVEMEHRQ